MSPNVHDLLQSALSLPDDQQRELYFALGEAMDQRGVPTLSDEWLAEIQRRSDEYDSGLVTPIPWEEVLERARARLKSND
ncbi:MAG: addiction module protein [Planctomycetales bacterium]|nr:addiction module protein [Planctomycetales bacterium]MBN8627589.1 addiction module protein [Planctomycetota bacterium]